MGREELREGLQNEYSIVCRNHYKENGYPYNKSIKVWLEDKVIEHKQLLYDKGVLHAKYQSRIKELEEERYISLHKIKGIANGALTKNYLAGVQDCINILGVD